MSDDLKIVLVASSRIALPVMQLLSQQKMLAGLAYAETQPEHSLALEAAATELGVPGVQLSKQDYAEKLAGFLRELQPHLVVVFTFGWRITRCLLDIPPLGFINIHPGPLPEMRGADPIFETIRQRRATAAITIHKMDEGWDTGAIVKMETFPLHPEFTYGMLSKEVAFRAPAMLAPILKQAAAAGQIPSVEQAAAGGYFPKIKPDDLRVRWTDMDAPEIKALVKACNPHAKGSLAVINGWIIGISEVSEVKLEGDASRFLPGSVIASDMQNGLLVYCRDGNALRLEAVYSEEGILPGYKLSMFGIVPGMKFS